MVQFGIGISLKVFNEVLLEFAADADAERDEPLSHADKIAANARVKNLAFFNIAHPFNIKLASRSTLSENLRGNENQHFLLIGLLSFCFE